MFIRSLFFIVFFTLISFVGKGYAEEFSMYSVDGVRHALPQDGADLFLYTYRLAGENLKACKDYKGSAANPLINRFSSFQVKPGSTGCRFTLVREGITTYRCVLPAKVAGNLGMEMISRSSGEALGDFSKVEMNILFDKTLCKVES